MATKRTAGKVAAAELTALGKAAAEFNKPVAEGGLGLTPALPTVGDEAITTEIRGLRDDKVLTPSDKFTPETEAVLVAIGVREAPEAKAAAKKEKTAKAPKAPKVPKGNVRAGSVAAKFIEFVVKKPATMDEVKKALGTTMYNYFKQLRERKLGTWGEGKTIIVKKEALKIIS